MQKIIEKEKDIVGVSSAQDISHVVEGLVAAWMIDDVLLEDGVDVVDVGVRDEQLRAAFPLVEVLQPILLHVHVAFSDARLPT